MNSCAIVDLMEHADIRMIETVYARTRMVCHLPGAGAEYEQNGEHAY